MTVSFLVVLTSALTNRALPLSRRNSTLFLALPRRKFLPVMVSFVPTSAVLGVTLVITGVLALRVRHGGHEERAERGRDDGAAQLEAGAGSKYHRPRYRPPRRPRLSPAVGR